MFSSSLPPVVCRRVHVVLTLYVFVCLRIVVSNIYVLYEKHDACLIGGRNCLPLEGVWVHLRFFVWSFFLMCSAFCVVFLLCLSSSCLPDVTSFLWIVHSWLHIFSSRFCFHLIKSVHNIIKNKYSTFS
jgi:hypothetical protein